MKTNWLISTPRRRLFWALVVAALFSDVFSIDPYRRAWRAFKTLTGLIDVGQRVSVELSAARVNQCRACPYLYEPLMTCGSPLRKELKEHGCWCNVEYKAQSTYGTCYADEQYGFRFGEPGWERAERVIQCLEFTRDLLSNSNPCNPS